MFKIFFQFSFMKKFEIRIKAVNMYLRYVTITSIVGFASVYVFVKTPMVVV